MTRRTVLCALVPMLLLIALAICVVAAPGDSAHDANVLALTIDDAQSREGKAPSFDSVPPLLPALVMPSGLAASRIAPRVDPGRGLDVSARRPLVLRI